MSVGFIYKSKISFLSSEELKKEIRHLAVATDAESDEKLTYIASRDYYVLRIIAKEAALANNLQSFEKILKCGKPETTSPGTREIDVWLRLALDLNNPRIVEVVLRNPELCDLRNKEFHLAYWLYEKKDIFAGLYRDAPLPKLEKHPDEMVAVFARAGTDINLVNFELKKIVVAEKEALDKEMKLLTEKYASLDGLIKRVSLSNEPVSCGKKI